MKKSDFYREWARVLDMCEGTGILTKNAWKFEGRFIGSDTPVFIEGHDGYEFAIAILEGKPVFVGDRIWLVRQQFWTRAKTGHLINDDVCSWNPPETNDTIPKHCGISANGYADIDGTYKLHVSNWTFHYRTSAERDKALAAIKELLK